MAARPDRARERARCIAAALPLALLFACAPKQRIPLDACVTEKVVVYVDGRLLETRPADLELRSDQPHKLYVKRPGEAPQLIVLESSEDGEGHLRLEPADPCKELVAMGLDRKLTIQVDEGKQTPPAPAPAPAP